ncbi:MAG: Holliday junction resolvase RuvX [Propionibacteriaceae bacterium]|jgi:putative Holliday junction resolvase|nr:Holliday junction resolvase RuvX [Propionibacteriaceae bacterium]
MGLAETAGVLLALDLGSARIGVAACDSGRILAFPVETIPAQDGYISRVVELLQEYNGVGLIIGYPLTLSGQAGIAAEKILAQAQLLANHVDVPVWLVDERMSSAEAHSKLRAAGRNAKNSREIIDTQAAVGILESVLCALREGRTIGKQVENKENHG